jgi:hypothetical protein
MVYQTGIQTSTELRLINSKIELKENALSVIKHRCE